MACTSDCCAQPKSDDEKPLFGWCFRNKFFATTPLIGFGFIHYSKRFEAILWYCLMAVFAYITVSDIRDLLIQWNREDTRTNMRVIYAKQFTLPNCTLCINGILPDYHLVKQEYGLVEPIAKDANLTYPWEKEVEKSFSILQKKHFFVGQYWHCKKYVAHCHYQLLPLAVRYFSALFASESFVGHGRAHWDRPAKKLDFKRQPPSENDLDFLRNVHRPPYSNVTKEFIHKVRDLNISDSLLMKKVTTEIFNMFDLSMQQIRFQISSQEVCLGLKKIRLTSTNGKKFCFLLDLSDCQINVNLEDSILISIDAGNYVKTIRYGYNSQLDVGYGPITERDYLSSISLQLYKDNDAAQTHQQPDIESRMGQMTFASIQKTAEYHALKRCSQNLNYINCRTNCHASQIRSSCSCIPFFFRKRSLSPTCTMERYLECLRVNVTEVLKCQSNCIPECIQHDYSILIKKRVSGDHLMRSLNPYRQFSNNSAPIRAAVKIDFSIWKYPVFKEQMASESQNFVADVGGILQFWLGASVLGLIHVLVYFGKQLFYCFKKDTKTGENVRHISHKFREATQPGIAVILGPLGEKKNSLGKEKDSIQPTDVTNNNDTVVYITMI